MLWNAKNQVVSIDGIEMAYASFGQGKKVFVLLPGLSDGLATVRGKALLLAPPYRQFFNNYTVYMFSRRDKLPEGYTIRDMADDQAEALKKLGIEKASVMGVSQGGMIAQYLAIDHPELVDRLVLAVTSPRADEIVQDCVGKWIGFALKGDHKSLMIDTAEKSYSEAALKKMRMTYPILGSVGKPADYSRFLVNARAILKFDASSELEKIQCPTLIIGGGDDQIVGAEASRKLSKGIPGSELFIYTGLGHAAYEEAKDFNERVFHFLERVN